MISTTSTLVPANNRRDEVSRCCMMMPWRIRRWTAPGDPLCCPCFKMMNWWVGLSYFLRRDVEWVSASVTVEGGKTKNGGGTPSDNWATLLFHCRGRVACSMFLLYVRFSQVQCGILKWIMDKVRTRLSFKNSVYHIRSRSFIYFFVCFMVYGLSIEQQGPVLR